jgi:hypothetical protein
MGDEIPYSLYKFVPVYGSQLLKISPGLFLYWFGIMELTIDFIEVAKH